VSASGIPKIPPCVAGIYRIYGSDEKQAVIDAIKNATGNDPSKITFE